VLQPQQLFGGMGAVFVAQHTATEALVALKVLWPHVMEHEPARQNFELEAKVAARVRSEHIVKVLDAGLDSATGAPFLVMELLEGVTLAEHVARNGPRPWSEAVAWMGQVAQGLDAAHGHRGPAGGAAPIVHRDLKPENLFLTTGSHGAPLVKILDYGIAKVLSQSTHLSREVRGTPRYMAFEQVAGEDISPRTDVWAFGLIAYFLLTGRCYWRSVDRVEALFAEILSLPTPPPSQRAREDGAAVSLPAGFDTWLLRCIDRNPSRRFASAGEAARALGALEPSPLGESAPSSAGVPSSVGSSGNDADPASAAPTQTIHEGLHGAAISAGSVPSLTRGLPERTSVRGPRGALIAIAAVAVLAAVIAVASVRLEDGNTGAESSAAAAVQGATPAGVKSVTLHSARIAEPIVAPVPASSVSTSDIVAEPSSTPRLAPTAHRVRAPRPTASARPSASPSPAPGAKRPPVFVELPSEPPTSAK
jgi:serine/threonine-protein kinase